MTEIERADLIRRLAQRHCAPTIEYVISIKRLHALSDDALVLVEKILGLVEHRPEPDAEDGQMMLDFDDGKGQP